MFNFGLVCESVFFRVLNTSSRTVVIISYLSPILSSSFSAVVKETENADKVKLVTT